MRKKRFIYTLAAVLLMCSAAGVGAGCGKSSPALLDSFGTHLDTLMTSKDKLSKMDGAAADLCVIENEDGFSENDIEAPAGALFNITDQKTLYSKNANDEREIASITKIMTALLAMKYADLSQEVTISYTPEGLESSAVLCGFEQGDKMMLSSLLSAALIYSGNDAAIDIAIAVAGSQEAFVDMMNQESKELMTSHTHFANPTGLTQSKHYSSVYDVYLMFQECLKYPTFRDIIARGSFLFYYTNAAGENVTKNFNSTNQYLVGAYTPPDGITVIGGKTGHTNTAGYNLVVLVQDSHHCRKFDNFIKISIYDLLYSVKYTILYARTTIGLKCKRLIHIRRIEHMVQIISGKKGKGKTKYLLDSVNGAVASAQGSVVYLDKTAKHMYELSNKVRLINVSDYGINSYDAFIGFVSGIISQDHDLEKMYFDSFLKISCLEGSDITEAIKALEAISAKFGVDFVLSVSADATELSDEVKSHIIVSL